MTVDNHSNGETPAEWKPALPPFNPDIHQDAEERDRDFQYVFDQLELVRQTDPDRFPKYINAFKPLWRLPTGPRQRILNYFIQPVIEAEESQKEDPEADRYQEMLEDTAGIPPYEARAIARGEPMVIPRPTDVIHPTHHLVTDETDPFHRGTPANRAFIANELARFERSTQEAEQSETLAYTWPEDVKFGVEPNGMVTHSRRERRAATVLQSPDFNQGGALRYLKVISHFGGKPREERVETMTKSLNHMFDYEEDALATIGSLGTLMKKISIEASGPDAIFGQQAFLKERDPKITHALEAITLYLEAIDARANPRKRIKGELAERMRNLVLSDTVDNIETVAAELYFREEERLKLWEVQLRGHPADRQANIPRRFGAIDIVKDIPELTEIVETRLRRLPDDIADRIAS